MYIHTLKKDEHMAALDYRQERKMESKTQKRDRVVSYIILILCYIMLIIFVYF